MPSLGGTHVTPADMHAHTLKNEINLYLWGGGAPGLKKIGSIMMVNTWKSSEEKEQGFCNFSHLGGSGSREIEMLLFAKLSPFFPILLILNPHAYDIYGTSQPIFKVGSSLSSEASGNILTDTLKCVS